MTHTFIFQQTSPLKSYFNKKNQKNCKTISQKLLVKLMILGKSVKKYSIILLQESNFNYLGSFGVCYSYLNNICKCFLFPFLTWVLQKSTYWWRSLAFTYV